MRSGSVMAVAAQSAETIAELPAFVKVAAEIGVKEVYLQRLVFFDEDAIATLKKDIAKIGGKWSIYIFSLSDDTFDDEFEGMKKTVTVAPIPEAILRVYRRIFQK